jgi:hypothetical protein
MTQPFACLGSETAKGVAMKFADVRLYFAHAELLAQQISGAKLVYRRGTTSCS